jgi:hypothetical protein
VDTDPMPSGTPAPVAVASAPIQTPMPTPTPAGIGTPAPTPTPIGPQDSVDMLLGDLHEVRPAPVKTTPASKGSAAAQYSAAHGLHRGQLTPAPEAKVIVERAPLPPTMKIDRVKVAEARKQVKQAMRQAGMPVDTTVPPPKSTLGRNLVIALGAGVVVVTVLIIAARMWGQKQKDLAVKANPSASALIVPTLQPAPTVTAAATTATVAATTTPEPTATEQPVATDTTPTLTATVATTATARPTATATYTAPNPYGTATAPTTTSTQKSDVKRAL